VKWFYTIYCIIFLGTSCAIALPKREWTWCIIDVNKHICQYKDESKDINTEIMDGYWALPEQERLMQELYIINLEKGAK